jgi:hypothetical protein
MHRTGLSGRGGLGKGIVATQFRWEAEGDWVSLIVSAHADSVRREKGGEWTQMVGMVDTINAKEVRNNSSSLDRGRILLWRILR